MKKRHSSEKNQKIRPGYHCRGRIWIENDGETFLGFGRMALLSRIHEFGSIVKAAASMKMSYKHAWDLVDAMNRQAEKPLVTTTRGGRGGGGARLTAAGEMAIREFAALYQRLTTFLAEETLKLKF